MLFWRQRVMLALLQNAPRKRAGKIQMLKWLFLLKEEEGIDRYGAFYDFLPYKHGPFSFVAYKEATELVGGGLIDSTRQSFRLTFRGGRFGAATLDAAPAGCVARIMRTYGRFPQRRLVQYVYHNYPWYASRSTTRQTATATTSKRLQPGVFCIGYEGLSIDAFLNAILKGRLTDLADVRSNAVSRKFGFSKPSLAKKCQDVGIEYHHYPELGIPAPFRRNTKTNRRLWHTYRAAILPKAAATFRDLVELCRQQRTGLLCFEKESGECHRWILAQEIRARAGIPIYQYHWDSGKWRKS